MTQRKTGTVSKKARKGTGAKRKIKDSVFTDLFGNKKYLLQLYRVLHPEDKDATEDDLTNITIKNVLIDNIYNDLGFMVKDRLMILIEAQSVFTVNIIVRLLLYLVQSYFEYFDEQGEDYYSTRKVKMPEPELYVICTGEQKRKPKYITLSKEFFNGKEIAIDAKVRMIYDSKEGDIINQYVAFTRVFDQQRKKLGYTKEAVEKTIGICKRRNVLKEYLQNREKEVLDIMMILYDEEQVVEQYGRRKMQEGEMMGLIKAYKDVGWSDADIIKKIVDEYQVTMKEARESVKNCKRALQPV